MADDETIVLCGLVANGPYPFDDNIEGFCEDCSAAIIWRPHSPEGTRLCFGCGMLRVEIAKDEGQTPEFVITQKVTDELRDLGFELKREDGKPN
jgi:hypothetical protein